MKANSEGMVVQMEQRGVQTGYFLAISLLLSALFYFFASNWPMLDRWEKIGVSVTVLALFYLSSYVTSVLLKRHAFLSNWLLVAGGLAFGLCVALLGQIYNSHADSYMLFVVWLIPNLLFAIFTRYQPFYVISYVLAHLALIFFLEPTVVHVSRESEWWYMIFWLIALGNMVLFWLTSTRKLPSQPIYYLSFLVFSVSLFFSSFVEVYDALPEILYLLVGAVLFVTFLKWLPNRGLLIATASMLSLFLLAKFFWYMLEYYSEGFFLVALLAAAGLVWGAVVGINWLRKESAHQKSKWVQFFQEAFTVLVTTIAAFIGAISLTGLLVLVFDDESVLYFIFFLSLIGFLAPALLLAKMNATVRYTLLTYRLFARNRLLAVFGRLLLGGVPRRSALRVEGSSWDSRAAFDSTRFSARALLQTHGQLVHAGCDGAFDPVCVPNGDVLRPKLAYRLAKQLPRLRLAVFACID